MGRVLKGNTAANPKDQQLADASFGHDSSLNRELPPSSSKKYENEGQLESANKILKTRNKQLRDKIEEVILEKMQFEEALSTRENFEELYHLCANEKLELQRKLDELSSDNLRGSSKDRELVRKAYSGNILQQDQLEICLDFSGEMKPITERQESEEEDVELQSYRTQRTEVSPNALTDKYSQFRQNSLIIILIKAVKFYFDKYKHAQDMNCQLKQLTKGENSLLLHSRSDPGLIELNFSNSRQEDNPDFKSIPENVDVDQLLTYSGINLSENLMQIFDQVIESSIESDVHTAIQFSSSMKQIFGMNNILEQKLHRDLYIYQQAKVLVSSLGRRGKPDTFVGQEEETEEANLIRLYRALHEFSDTREKKDAQTSVDENDKLEQNRWQLCDAALHFWRWETPADILILSEKFRDDIEFDKPRIDPSKLSNPVMVQEEMRIDAMDSKELSLSNADGNSDDGKSDIELIDPKEVEQKIETPERVTAVENTDSDQAKLQTDASLISAESPLDKIQVPDDPKIQETHEKAEARSPGEPEQTLNPDNLKESLEESESN